MATAKKKPAAKSNVKYAAKSSQATSARTASKAAASAAANGAAWAQKSANEWAKQSAKLYQMPFVQGDMGAASKQAAQSMQTASDSMMKMGADMMQQMFGQGAKSAPQASFMKASFNPQEMFSFAKMPKMDDMFAGMPKMDEMFAHMPKMQSFDPAAVQEKLSSFARESAAQLSKSASSAKHAASEAAELSRENAEAAVEVANVAVTMSKELGAEMISYLNKVFAQNVELSKEVLGCRTLNDMFDLVGRMTKANLDSFFSESVKLSEMMFQGATNVSEPLNERISETSERLTKAMAA
jgi:hypothetical protein